MTGRTSISGFAGRRRIELQSQSAVAVVLAGIVVAGCGGGSSSPAPQTNNPQNPAPLLQQSPGGIWAGAPGTDAITILIAESGELVITEPAPAIGSGAVVVTDTDSVAGSYTLHTAQVSPTSPRVSDQTCTIDGTVRERVSLVMDVTCEDADANVTERSFSFVYVRDYETPSSLDEIAANYTLSFNQDTNSLSISSNGELFGMFHNGGINCVVNGTAEVIDPQFALYRFVFNFANCTGIFDEYEGTTMTGLGHIINAPFTTPGSFFLVITGEVDSSFRVFSVLYERV